MINDQGSNIKEVVEYVIKNMSPNFDPSVQDEIMDHVNQYSDYKNETNRASLYISLKKLLDEKVKMIKSKNVKTKSLNNETNKKN